MKRVAVAVSALLLSACVIASATSARPVGEGPGGEVLWSADMEEGTFADWDADDGGNEVNSGVSDAFPTQDVARGGEWSAGLSITSPPESATRLFRWAESRNNRDLVYAAWFYIPEAYAFTGATDTGRYLNLFQYKSATDEGRPQGLSDPFWHLNVNTDDAGDFVLELVWWPEDVEGPHDDEGGYERFRNDVAEVPIGRWFQVEGRLRQSKDFDGIVQFWLDGEMVYDMRDVKTGHASCYYNDWCVDQSWSVNLYSDGLTPAPSLLYVDDAQIRRPG